MTVADVRQKHDISGHGITPRECRMARAGLGLYRNEVADYAGIHPLTLKRVERGVVRPQRRTIDNLLRFFTKQGVVFGADGSVRVTAPM